MTVDTADPEAAAPERGGATSAALEAAYGPGGVGILVGLGILAAAAQLITRGLAPALPGVWVGMAATINGLKLVAALLAQLFAVGATASLIGLVMATVRSEQPAHVRAFSVGTGVLTVLAVMIASAVRLPSVSRMVLAGVTTVLALLSARESLRSPTTRAAGLVCGLLGVAGALRLLTISLSTLAATRVSTSLVTGARVAATLFVAVVVMAVLASLVWIARVGQARSVGWVTSGLVVALAIGATVVVTMGADPEAGGVPLWLFRSLEELVPRPLPFGALLPLMGLEALRWLAATVALASAPNQRAMGACLALALVSGGSLEIPSCAISLTLATLALALHPRAPNDARRPLLRR